MKKKLILLSALALFIHANATDYTIQGVRWIRKYSAPGVTQVYNAEADAQRIALKMCDVPWQRAFVETATAASHAETNLDENVSNRDAFDAALFCAYHVRNEHRVYANAACYRFEFPAGTLPRLTSLSTTVYSDPYNTHGARISIITSDDDTIPTDCATVRGDVSGGIKATNVAPRVTVTSGGKDFWHPAVSNLVFDASSLGASGLQLKRYLFVFVLMENYATSRGNWIEGCSYVENDFKITTSDVIPGWTSTCDVAEPYATDYHLTEGGADQDADGDGLSNYAEYVITEIFGLADLDPDNARSDGSTPDYFRKVGDLYLGEIFTDHDRMDDLWEIANDSACRPGIFDPFADPDGDGWSNLSEFLAGTDPYAVTGSSGNEFPVPSVTVRVTWSEPGTIDGSIRVIAYGEDDPGMNGAPTVWSALHDERFGSFSVTVRDPVEGHVSEGVNRFVVFCDEDANGKYSPGEPFAYAGEVRVGHAGASFAVNLSRTSPVFARVDLTAAAPSCDCEIWKNDAISVTDISSDTAANRALRTKMGVVTDSDLDLGSARLTRIRVLRVLVDDENTLGVDQWGYDVPVKSVVLDKYLDLGTRSYIHEGDFIAAGELDVGWSQTRTEVYGRNVYPFKNAGIYSCIDSTNITYAIVLGEGEIGDSNLVFRCVFNRTYDAGSARFAEGGVPTAATVRPVIDRTQPQDLVYGARPTFRWAMQNGGGANFNSYTAFRLVITNASGTVWRSAFRPLPAKDASGWYAWTLDEPIGAVIPASGNYAWRVAMYNAKFTDYSFWNDVADYYAEWYTYGAQALRMVEWSEAGAFTVDMNNQQAMNDHGYSSIAAAVKYAGPACVTAAVGGSAAAGRLVVEAFASPDFSGAPLARAFATDRASITNVATSVTNVVLKGLDQSGKYYLRAFIDTDGDGTRDNWESWGAATDAVTLNRNVIATASATIWIEDADTDGDGFPDAYEMASLGSLTNLTGVAKTGDRIRFPSATYSGAAKLSDGLGGVSFVPLRSASSAMGSLLGNALGSEISIKNLK